jgi:propionyl-CoA carboxylase beta chain
MFLTGPDVTKTVTHEEVDAESLGGAMTHHTVSSACNLTAPSDQESLASVRKCKLSPNNNVENPPFADTGDPVSRMDETLNQLVPKDPGVPYSMHNAIPYIVASGSFLELLGGFARNAIVGLARMGGMPVGIVSQEPDVMGGAIDIDASDKICRFVRFCDAYNIPIVTFVDSHRLHPGTDQEYRGIIGTAPRCCMPMPRQACPRSALSPVRHMAAHMSSCPASIWAPM